MEGAEAVGSALDEFHFAVEALCDAVVAGEAPHADDLLGPAGESLPEGEGRFEAAGFERGDQAEQFLDMLTTRGLALGLEGQQPAEFFLEGIKARQDRLLGEEPGQSLALGWIESVAAGAQQPEPGAVPAQRGTELAGELEQMLADQPDGVEAVGHDLGAGKPTADDRAVGVGQVDADDSDALPAPQGAQVGGQLRLAAAGAEVEDPAVLQVAEGGGEALAAMQGVLIDTKHLRAVQALAFPGFALGELGVDAAHRGRPQSLPPSQGRGTDAVIVALEDPLSPRLRAASARPDARQGLHKTAGAVGTAVTPAGDHQLTGLAKAGQMAHPAFIPPLAAEASASAARALSGRVQRLNVDPHPMIALPPDDAVSGKR